MKFPLIAIAAAGGIALATTPAAATGKIKCDVPTAEMRAMDALEA